MALVGQAEAKEPEFDLSLFGLCSRGWLGVQGFIGGMGGLWLGDVRVCVGVVEAVPARDAHGERC